MSRDLVALLWLQAWTGAPLYLLAAFGQGVYLHRRGLSAAPIAATAVFSCGLSVLAGVVLWGRFFADRDILLWDTVNLPAALACVAIFPLVAGLVGIGFAPGPGR